ncbi:MULTISPECIES: anti-sigma factor [Nocardioides]|uniref:Anti-sigma-K factor rskA n=1 Tax=Nocardioides lianchengensis TaxID=1045774 RepID=A0A1G6KUU1_9ACTN|nr:anti-sigma factor [Nocardioides lianchengensis]NYG13704.1 hypothetical protein [Nocardioides lianchengensis]SDC34723.1 Anti-sigma-K factor rskA [Nocardioides lianchengensis]
MSEHPDLLALLRAELSNHDAATTGDHLDACAQCREDLAELATAHAMLARSGRTLGVVPAADELRPAPAPRRSRRGPLLLAAAAVAVAATAGTTYGVLHDDEEPAPAVAVLDPVEGTATGRVEMTPGDGGTRMTITTHDLPAAGSGRFYQAWLLDPATNKMLALGQLGPRGTASFEIDDALLGSYGAIDVSLEDDDGDPQHSVTSVLRASYDTDG